MQGRLRSKSPLAGIVESLAVQHGAIVFFATKRNGNSTNMEQ